MDAAVRQALEEHRSWLAREVREGHDVLAALEKAGLTLHRIEPTHDRATSRRSWLLYCAPPRAIIEQYDLAPELLVVLAPWEVAQAREIAAAERALGADHRLDRGLVIFVARDLGSAQRVVAQAVRHTGRMLVVLSEDELLRATDPKRWLREVLGDRLARSDLFAAGRPVFGWDFVGRAQELRALRGRLLDGRPVGLYGLRKVGKTSMLLSLRDRLIDDAHTPEGVVHAIPIHVDLLAVSFSETNLHGVTRLVLEATLKAVRALGIEGQLELPPALTAGRRRRSLAPSECRHMMVSLLERLLDWAAEQPSRPPILLLIDEYERLLGGSRIPVEDGLDFLDYLRGLTQQHVGDFNFLVTGLDARRASQPRHAGRQNPLFDFLVEMRLDGLRREDLHELIRKVGHRLSLHFERDALDFIWEQTGGHPYLAREYGRIIDASVPASERRAGRRSIDLVLVRAHLDAFRRAVDNTMREIYETMTSIDPHAVDLLSLARTPADLEGLPAATVDAFRALGVLHGPGAAAVFRIRSFEAWLHHNHAALPAAADG